MKTHNRRVIIYPKDVMRITGKSERYGRKILKKIKERNHKEEHQYVTLGEFAQYTGLSLDLITPFITD
jgi:hypothetical protein